VKKTKERFYRVVPIEDLQYTYEVGTVYPACGVNQECVAWENMSKLVTPRDTRQEIESLIEAEIENRKKQEEHLRSSWYIHPSTDAPEYAKRFGGFRDWRFR